MVVPIKVDDIIVWGIKGSAITPEEVESIEPSITSQVHILRHFNQLSENYLLSLIGKTYTYYNYLLQQYEEKIVDINHLNELMQTKGSKFNSNILGINTPVEVIETIKNYLKKKSVEIFWIVKDEQEIALFSFNLPENIGSCGIVELKALPGSLRSKVVEEVRGKTGSDNNIIKTIEVTPESTKKMAVTLKKTAGKLEVSRAHPGILSPDFPDRSTQIKEEYEYNKEFWDTTAFIKN